MTQQHDNIQARQLSALRADARDVAAAVATAMSGVYVISGVDASELDADVRWAGGSVRITLSSGQVFLGTFAEVTVMPL
jgi:hypothetical protein